MLRNLFSILTAALVIVGCSQESNKPLLTSSDLTQTYAALKGNLTINPDAAPGAPAACPVDGNKDTFNSVRLLASYERFYQEFDPVIADDEDQNYCVVVNKKGNKHTIRVIRLNARLKERRANLKYVRGFDTCQEAKDFRSLVLDDYHGLNQVQGTQAVSNTHWTLHLFRHEMADDESVLRHFRQQYRLDIQVVAPGGSSSAKAGYTDYDLEGYDETTTYTTQQEARNERKRLLLEYTRGSDTKQGGPVIYFYQIASEGFPFDKWEIKGQNSRPWIQGGRWVDADDDGTKMTTDDVFIFEGSKHECGISTVNIDIGRTPQYVGPGLTVDDPDGVLSAVNPNEVDVNGNGTLDRRDRDRNGNGRYDQDDVILGQYRNADGSKVATFGDKRDVRVIGLFDKDDDGMIEVSDLDENGNNRLDRFEIHDYFHGTEVFVERDADRYCDKVVHFEYFPYRKEGISGKIWAGHRLYTWLEFGE